MDELSALLVRLSSADNAVRSEAERQYQSLKVEPSTAAQLPAVLLSVASGAGAVVAEHRVLAAVLLRRLLLEDEMYSKLDASGQASLRHGLVEALAQESDTTLKARLCDVVGDLAGTMGDASEWPEVLRYAQQAILSPSPVERETGLTLLGLLAPAYIDVLLADVQTVAAVFQRCLLDDSNEGRVMVAAGRAVHAVLVSLPLESDYEKFRGIVGATLNAMQIALDRLGADQWAEATAVAYAEHLVDMADECAPFFGEHLGHVLTCGLQLAERPHVPSSVRHMLVEFLVSVCSSLYKSVRKVKGPEGEKGFFATRFFSICARLMVGLKDDPSWERQETQEGEDAEDDEDWMDSEVGEQAADRVAHALGLRATFAPITAQLQTLLYSPHWQHQRAGLQLMGNYLEVCVAAACVRFSTRRPLLHLILICTLTVRPSIPDR